MGVLQMMMKNEKLRNQIAEDTKQFLEIGGKIEVLKPGPYPDGHPCKDKSYRPSDLEYSGYFDNFLNNYKNIL